MEILWVIITSQFMLSQRPSRTGPQLPKIPWLQTYQLPPHRQRPVWHLNQPAPLMESSRHQRETMASQESTGAFSLCALSLPAPSLRLSYSKVHDCLSDRPAY